MVFGWKRKKKKNVVWSKCFLLGPIKMFSPQNGEKTEGASMIYLNDKNAPNCFFFFLKLLLSYVMLALLFCKVEFNQPSCWLYSVPNLLVF